MDRIEFENFKDKIKSWADKSALEFGRGITNIEDDFRSAIELLPRFKKFKETLMQKNLKKK